MIIIMIELALIHAFIGMGNAYRGALSENLLFVSRGQDALMVDFDQRPGGGLAHVAILIPERGDERLHGAGVAQFARARAAS